MRKILQSAGVALLKAFSYIPFPVIYLISDFIYILIFHVVKYRSKVVYTNLRNAFPEKDTKEINAIARKFYHHFCDLLVESIKLHSMSEKELDKRLMVNGIDTLEDYFRQGKSCVLIGMHYNNWEWGSSIQRLINNQILIVFNPVRKNDAMERYLLNMRERFGSKTVDISHAARMAFRLNKSGQPICLFLAADQTPPKESQFWTTFLNQETAFFSGPEKIATRTNQPVCLYQTRKTARGKYQVDIFEIFPEPQNIIGNTILLEYADRLEKIIHEKPEYWLWSHRRWKHKRPEGTKLVPRK